MREGGEGQEANSPAPAGGWCGQNFQGYSLVMVQNRAPVCGGRAESKLSLADRNSLTAGLISEGSLEEAGLELMG